MNNLSILKEAFLSGQLKKWEYFEKIYSIHDSLFDYSEFIKDTNISKIEIEDDSVILTCRNSQIKFSCAKGENRAIPLSILNLGDYETEELNMQLQLIKNGDTVFDIGGNIGWYALHVAKVLPLSTIYTFEPVPWTFNLLKRNLQINELKNIFPYNLGFSDKTGDLDFFFDPTISGNASLTNVAEKEDIQIFRCKVLTLDEYIEKEKVKIDYIKCDVEGAELFVFKGGINTLKKYKPIVFSEMLRKWSAKFNYHPNQIIDLFKQLDYLPYIIDRKTKLRKFEMVDEKTIETNYFFLHSEKHTDIIKRFVI
jgi:FkbM family methyltransferase